MVRDHHMCWTPQLGETLTVESLHEVQKLERDAHQTEWLLKLVVVARTANFVVCCVRNMNGSLYYAVFRGTSVHVCKSELDLYRFCNTLYWTPWNVDIMIKHPDKSARSQTHANSKGLISAWSSSFLLIRIWKRLDLSSIAPGRVFKWMHVHHSPVPMSSRVYFAACMMEASHYNRVCMYVAYSIVSAILWNIDYCKYIHKKSIVEV